VSVISNGVTQKAKRAGGWKFRSKPVESSGRQIHWNNFERRWDSESTDKEDPLMPGCQEKLLASTQGDRTKTDTGGKVEYTKARERNLVKELGNLAP
jgi:hypothetical protein